MCLFKKEKKGYKRIVTILGIKISYKSKKKKEIEVRSPSFCPLCKKNGHFKPMGLPYQKDAICPHCDSLERHRFLYFVYNMFLFCKSSKIKLLHMAPEQSLYDLFEQCSNIDYTGMDLFPELYPFCKNCSKEDVTKMSFADESFDVVVSNQVLEHIQSEKMFFDEVFRVLKPGGMLFLNIPFLPSVQKTFEDETIASPEERLKAFGQEDHVRLYGRDFEERIRRLCPLAEVTKLDEAFMGDKLIEEMKLRRQAFYPEEKEKLFNDAYFVITKKHR